MISGEGGILSSSNGNAVVANNTNSFPIDEDEYDFDRPTEGFASVADAVEDIRQGKVVNCSSFSVSSTFWHVTWHGSIYFSPLIFTSSS